VTELDIRRTLYQVCHKVAHDHSVDDATLKKRIKALYILGKVFMETGGSKEAGMNDMLTRIKTAASAATAKEADEEAQKDSKETESSASSVPAASASPASPPAAAPAAKAAASETDLD
jgi:pyruvate/2-oxoglutarate dehydrogenase complex dihydrolipoamide acyltransferase (E2) component